jgi:3-phytase
MSHALGRACRVISRHLAWSISAAALLACSTGGTRPASEAGSAKAAPPSMMPQIKPGPVSIKESFVARREATSKLVGLTLVINPVGVPWVYTADASTDELVVFDAPTGRFNRKFGKRGSAAGEFDGITDVAAVDRILYVAEAGNRRIQMLYMPEHATLGYIGSDLLTSPRAVQSRTLGGGNFTVYVVDRAADQLVLRLIDVLIEAPASPPGTDPIFSLDMKTVTTKVKHVKDVALGLAPDAPVSLRLDLSNELLLVASGQTLKSFRLDGNPRDADLVVPTITGQISGLGLFACPQAPTKGYWILGDRSADGQFFQVIDRVTMAPVTRFNGLQIKDSGALYYAQDPMAYFPFGAVYALNQQTSVGALNWQVLAAETGVRRICL